LIAIFFAALGPLFVEHVVEPHLAYNHTSSMPRGFYWRSPVPLGGPRRGDLVIACAPTAFARFGASNGFLDVGRCDGVTSLLKRVVAIAGDHVHLDARGVRINGAFLQGSRPTHMGRSGGAIPHVPYGDYELSAGDVWLASPQAKSFDSRYFGPVSDVLAIARPVLVEGSEVATPP
jgi:conjugative transfer signal peptidase TraF